MVEILVMLLVHATPWNFFHDPTSYGCHISHIGFFKFVMFLDGSKYTIRRYGRSLDCINVSTTFNFFTQSSKTIIFLGSSFISYPLCLMPKSFHCQLNRIMWIAFCWCSSNFIMFNPMSRYVHHLSTLSISTLFPSPL